MRRRDILVGGVVGGAAFTLAGLPFAASASEVDEAEWIYLSPFKTDGALSRCQAEVWFVGDGADFCVVTASDAWRAQAVREGLARTQVWIGQAGQWQSSNGRYKRLPSVIAQASFETDPTMHARLLRKFGAKYTAEWGSWGPRFKRGLADGSRVMLRYTPAPVTL